MAELVDLFSADVLTSAMMLVHSPFKAIRPPTILRSQVGRAGIGTPPDMVKAWALGKSVGRPCFRHRLSSNATRVPLVVGQAESASVVSRAAGGTLLVYYQSMDAQRLERLRLAIDAVMENGDF